MIVHIDTDTKWRGGQQQAFYLHQRLTIKGNQSLMICKKDSILHQKCIENKLPCHCLPLMSELDVFSAFCISRIAQKHKAAILQLHDAHAVTIGILAKYFFRNVKLIAMRRVDFPIKKRSLVKYNHRFLEKVICISNNIYNIALGCGIDKEKLAIIHSGVDTSKKIISDKSKIQKEYNIPSQNMIIGTIAAIVGHKDYPTLLKAAKIVIENEPNVTFIACGDGPLKNAMLSLHQELNLNEAFIFASFQKDIDKYLGAFDIFVLSSKMEGLGTAVLDAMVAKKPIVACSSGGIPEMISDNINGLLAERENPVDLATKILSLVRDQTERLKIGEQAFVDVEKFSIESTVMSYQNLYFKLTKTNI
ncbi:MAG: glycosyltransferase [Candidatus Cloacimonetes bacterium]|nr:glycosyltransferase [Candidatus Cloacimonadota bacterium]